MTVQGPLVTRFAASCWRHSLVEGWGIGDLVVDVVDDRCGIVFGRFDAHGRIA